MRNRQRGSVLLLVMIILGVLMVVGAAVMYRGTAERASATAMADFEGSTSCARAAYGILWADFLASGSGPLQGIPTMTFPDPNHPGQNIQFTGGHFDQNANNCDQACRNQIKVQMNSSVSAGVKQGPTESTNTFREGFGGTPTRFTAHCTYPSGAEYEVEFLLRLGM